MQSDTGQLPAQGSDAIEILLNDHEVIRTLLERLVQAGASDRREAVQELKAILTIHNATEENLVYPALTKVARKKWESQRLYHETAEADVLMFELDTMLKEGDDESFERVARRLRDAVLEHMDDEEQSAFPHLQQKADAQQTRLLTASVREFRTALRFNPSGDGRGSGERGEIAAGRTRQAVE
jgi:hemerythrin superfamily protein